MTTPPVTNTRSIWRDRVICFVGFVAFYVATGALLDAFMPRDTTDTAEERSGLRLFTDHGTGCQYVKGGWFGGTTPRLDARGLPMCGDAT